MNGDSWQLLEEPDSSVQGLENFVLRFFLSEVRGMQSDGGTP